MIMFVLILDFSFFTTEQFVLLRKMRGQDLSRRLTDNQPRGSIQTPNGSCLNDAATLERENEDLKVLWISLHSIISTCSLKSVHILSINLSCLLTSKKN